MSEPDEELWTECIFCAGTGKIRDYPGSTATSLFGAATSFIVDPEALKGIGYDFHAICGT